MTSRNVWLRVSHQQLEQPDVPRSHRSALASRAKDQWRKAGHGIPPAENPWRDWQKPDGPRLARPESDRCVLSAIVTFVICVPGKRESRNQEFLYKYDVCHGSMQNQG